MIHDALEELEAAQAALRDSHKELRRRLVEIDTLAIPSTDEDPSQRHLELVAAVWGLLLAFDRHVAFVSDNLARHVERLHGVDRMRNVRGEHAVQRARIVDMINRSDSAARRADGSLDVAAEELTNQLRGDLAREEHLLDLSGPPAPPFIGSLS